MAIPTDKEKHEIDDPIWSPLHYKFGDIECIDAIRASMSREEYRGYLKGTALKYLWRYNHKGKPLEDLEKEGYFSEKLREDLRAELDDG